MRFNLLLSAAVCAGLMACSPHPSDTDQPASEVAPAAEAEPSAAPEPTHNYASLDNGVYLYPEALSEDDVKAGKAAGGFVGFRYLGELNGVYLLQPEGSPQVESCTNPCTVIKVTVNGELTDRVQYVPGSIVAAAFDDAFSGQLKPQVNVPTYNSPQGTDTDQTDGQTPAS